MSKLFETPYMRETLKRLIRSQMAAKGMEYKDLTKSLATLGVNQREGTLRTKINTGTMGAQLFLYIQLAMGINNLPMATIEEILADVEDKDPQEECE